MKTFGIIVLVFVSLLLLLLSAGLGFCGLIVQHGIDGSRGDNSGFLILISLAVVALLLAIACLFAVARLAKRKPLRKDNPFD
jgi:uncharacterized BrkB/YihY/UPF0761 family membrane protein